ncbi:MAG: hypothetical protein MRZ73_09860 [Pseudoflavonifractor capillosus]|uniref:flagellin N-terminal helical domain-containing protein n=1 Tax=Pseudoflavonifractor capillosus TaxID=106588 RepID=UPI0023F72996|nr:hypothetical protein [Pseudoflavonifractor capillosus]MCI5928831.1 hypothetical protein [Pseudoflavonifractor capillosus]MDY4660315.1 hypothetical protein [Pseudoflavonifractor capillosus]
MIRVTTNSTIYTYKNNLLKSSNQLYSAMNALMSGRNFDSYSADPAAATRAFKIHSSLNATNTQYSNNTTVLNKVSTAWDVADDIIDNLVRDLAEAPALSGLNDTNLSTLNTQGDVLFSGAEAIIQSLNSKYDGSFLFNGSDTQNPPFALETVDDKTYVTYRGVRIDDPDTLDDTYLDDNDQPVLKADGTPMTNREMLDKWSQEHQYVDIGIGFEVDKNGNVIDSTAFDSAISGTDFIGGCGVDEDGDPTNIVSIMVRLSEVFRGYDAESGSWSSAGNKEDAQRLAGKLTKAQEALSAQHSNLETQAKYLETNKSQLESSFSTLNTELNGIEKVDEVEAILTLSSAQTSYNAALHVGANVIPQSLMDYLN